MTRTLPAFAALALAASLTGCSTPAVPAVPADAAASPTTSTPTTPPSETTTSTPAPGPTMGKGDVQATVKILEKQCFGSAGCNVTYRVDLATSAVDPAGTYSITYEVNGLDDTALDTVQVVDGKYNQRPRSGGTKKSTDKLTATVTDVVKES